jgi:hypothetical protein
MDVLIAGAVCGSSVSWLGGYCLADGACVRLKNSLLFLPPEVKKQAAYLADDVPRASSWAANGSQPSASLIEILDDPDLVLASNVWVVRPWIAESGQRGLDAAKAALDRAIAASASFGAACARAGLDGPSKWPPLLPASAGSRPFAAIGSALEAAEIARAANGAPRPAPARRAGPRI